MNATIKLENEKHFPVLLNEIISILTPHYGGTFIDCTFGQGGYSKKILENNKNKIFAIDRDLESAKVAIDFGAVVIEKHFTVDKDLPGRDNKFAILPNELKRLKDSIDIFTKVNKNLGSNYQECELDSRENYTGRFDG